MLYPIKVVDIELSHPIQAVEGLDGYLGLRGLIRLHGIPIGYISAPITLGHCTAETLSKLILEQHSWAILCQLLENGLASPQRPEELTLEHLIALPPVEYSGEWPLVTVVVCTRDRPDDMKLCLEAITKLDYSKLDILVVDNAPKTEATKELVETHYPQVRYVREPRPGLDWARNRAILEAKGEIIAYTDDDVVVDPGWVKAIAKTFTENSEVMGLAGLVVPYELETEPQVLFEMNGGFGKGFERKWYRVNRGEPIPWYFLGTGNVGTGANMAYRRSVFNQIGGFDPALDVGTVTNGAGDCEMFFRVIKEGHTLVYEPNAVIRHRHRSSYQKLRAQLSYNGGAYSYMLRSVLAYPNELFSFAYLGLFWFVSWHLQRLLNSLLHPARYPRDLILAELQGCLVGLFRYFPSRRNAAKVAAKFGNLPISDVAQKLPWPKRIRYEDKPIAVRVVELTQPLKPITDVAEYPIVRVFVSWQGSPIGSVDVFNQNQPISAMRLRQVIVQHLGYKLMESYCLHPANPKQVFSQHIQDSQGHYERTQLPPSVPVSVVKAFNQHIQDSQGHYERTQLPPSVPVSVIIATCDRPKDLRRCLERLTTQESSRKVEIIVVDNRPASGLTPAVVAEFPGTILVNEPRPGANYARNAGIAASTGEIIALIDDDVAMGPDWLEKLITPFSRADVMVVTGNILPRELETYSQRLFEQYGDGGLGRGFTRFEVNGHWFQESSFYAVKTWLLGGTANSAFRASIFHHPQIGLAEEALGPGMPSGAGEDIYIFYKVLKAGYTIVYEPAACVWHLHRRTMVELRHQLYNYSKGFIAYHLTTWLQDGDFRGLMAVITGVPMWQLWRIKERLLRRYPHPLPMILLEMVANLSAPWSLWHSWQRVKREGRSTPYVPVSERMVEQEPVLMSSHNFQSSLPVSNEGDLEEVNSCAC